MDCLEWGLCHFFRGLGVVSGCLGLGDLLTGVGVGVVGVGCLVRFARGAIVVVVVLGGRLGGEVLDLGRETMNQVGQLGYTCRLGAAKVGEFADFDLQVIDALGYVDLEFGVALVDVVV